MEHLAAFSSEFSLLFEQKIFSWWKWLEIKCFFPPCFVGSISSINEMHKILPFLGLERNVCSEKQLKTVVPEVSITWMYNAFVWKKTGSNLYSA